MYVIAFATLVIALLGAYSQIFTKQAAQVLARQSGAFDAMIAWHATAVSQASQLVSKTSMTTTGCLLTPTSYYSGFLPSQAANPCSSATGPVSVQINESATSNTAPVCVGSTTGTVTPCWTSLPTGYAVPTGFNHPPYSFYSIAFSDGANPAHYYVLTYVPSPPNGGDTYSVGYLCLPGVIGATTTCSNGSVQMSVSFSTFLKQMNRNQHLAAYDHGTVTASGTLTTTALLSGITPAVPATYTIPSNVPVGSVGLITPVPSCSGC